MFDIGFWELSLIGIVALLVVGPDKLPGVAREAGRMLGRAQRMAGDLRREFEQEADFEAITKLRDTVDPDELASAARRFQAELSELSKVDANAPPPPPDLSRTGGDRSADANAAPDTLPDDAPASLSQTTPPASPEAAGDAKSA